MNILAMLLAVVVIINTGGVAYGEPSINNDVNVIVVKNPSNKTEHAQKQAEAALGKRNADFNVAKYRLGLNKQA